MVADACQALQDMYNIQVQGCKAPPYQIGSDWQSVDRSPTSKHLPCGSVLVAARDEFTAHTVVLTVMDISANNC